MNLNIYNPYVREELYLMHHGIAGQRWGKRNGPPYPLSAGAHSASEKKAGWRKSLDKGNGRAGARELNRLDQKRATAYYDEYMASQKGRKYKNKAEKAERKGNYEKADKYKDKYMAQKEKATNARRTQEAMKEKTREILKEMTAKGFNIYSKETDRVVHAGKSVLKSTLATTGIMAISMFAGAPITGAVMSSHTVSGTRYKAKKSRYGTSGSVKKQGKKKQSVYVFGNPSATINNSVEKALAEVRAERNKKR